MHESPKIFYGWYILFAAFFVYALGHGLMFSFGVFLKPLSENFQWSRSLTAGAFMIFMACRALSSVVMGGLTDRFGARAVVVAGGLLMGMGTLLGGIMTSVWELYLFYGVLAGTGMGVVSVPLSSTVSRWFVTRRGLTQGVLVVGAGLGNFAVAPAAGYLVLGFGISDAYVILGAISLICIVLLALVLKKEPAEIGLQPYGAPTKGALETRELQKGHPETLDVDWEISQALHTPSFWLLASVGFIFGISHYITTTNIVAYGTDMQIPAATAPLLLTLIGGSNIAGVIVMSLVIERIGSHRSLVLCMGFQALAMFWLTWAANLTHFMVGTLIFGPSYGGMVLCLLVITPEFFGLKNLGSIMGLIFFIHLMGGAAGPELGNLIYDLTEPHSYSPAFFLTGCAATAAVVLGLIMRKPQHSASP
ncbi:MAG: MFS transporter [Deltaproteobacteria bacterium]|nr:MFS transporter [Deltaproteobacteria bacterium]